MKLSRKLEFTAEARRRIHDRDRRCIFCEMKYHMDEISGGTGLQIMHIVPRSQLGKGTETNGILGCVEHHMMMDNGNKGRREEMLQICRNYLIDRCPGWNAADQVYSKWQKR